jgi:hypothetical protein
MRPTPVNVDRRGVATAKALRMTPTLLLLARNWTVSPRERRTRRTAEMDVLMLIVVFIIGYTPNWLLNLIF